MAKEIIPYGKQSITQEDIDAVSKVLSSDFLTQGPEVERFERSVAKFVDAPFAVALTNGTAALHIAALALGVKAGSKVIVSPLTFAASANCIRYCGGDVIFCDIDPETACLDLNSVEKIFEQHPKGAISGVVAVDFAGFPVAMDQLKNLCDKNGAWILEDACHALGARFKDKNGDWQTAGNGRYSTATVFSFHPVKHVATGEGGMITTANEALAKRMRKLRTHGITKDASEMGRNDGGWYYEMQELGFNYRISDILCVLGTSQMQRLDENLKLRHTIAERYDRELKGVGDLRLPRHEGVLHAFHLYVVRTSKRLALYNFLKERGIFCQVHYIPVYRLPYYEKLYGVQSKANTDQFYQTCLSLPMYHGLSEGDQARVIEEVRRFFSS